MKEIRKKLKPLAKIAIIKEAGNKCANPGCSNWRVHIHHIKHWAVYESNDQSILIAVCPSCHDAIHYGQLNISDDTLFKWKGIKRESKPKTTHLYVEPSQEIKLLTGTIALSTTNESATIFELSENNKLSFRVLDSDINLLNIAISDLQGNEVLKVKDNYIKIQDDSLVSFKQVPGHVRISTNHVENFLPVRFLQIMKAEQPDYAKNDEAVLLDLEVIKPGLVRVKGCWADNRVAVVITDYSLSFLRDGLQRPLSMVGDGENSVLMFAGPVTSAMFGFK